MAPASKTAPRFENAAAQHPYMFVGALSGLDSDGELIQTALGAAVMDPNNVTAREATMGWAIPAEVYYTLGTNVSVGAISEACYKHFKGSVDKFKEKCTPDTWSLWENLATSAEASGLLDAIRKVRAVATDRDTRKIVITDALYFAGIVHDEPGANRIAWSVRDTKIRNEKVQAFISTEAVFESLDAMRAAAAAIAEEVCVDAAVPKRKRADDQEPLRKMRRANMMTAIMDAVSNSIPVDQWTPEEVAFVESGPRKMSEIVERADIIARKRITVARTAAA